MGTVRCCRCGKTIDSTMSFCPYCGEKNFAAGSYAFKGDPQGGARQVRCPTNTVPAFFDRVKIKSHEKNLKSWSRKGKIIAGLLVAVLIIVIVVIIVPNGSSRFVGSWAEDPESDELSIMFKKDGTGVDGEWGLSFTWDATDGKLILSVPIFGITKTYRYRFEGSKLYLIDTDDESDVEVLYRIK